MFVTCCCYYVYFGLLLAATCSTLISAQGSFTLDATSYSCPATDVASNLICLGDAHRYEGQPDGTFAGRLSLIQESGDFAKGKAAIAYYNQPMRMRDISTRQSASFNTSFYFDEIPSSYNVTTGNHSFGDGITFLISADNSSIGESGGALGYFKKDGTNDFKSVVVEFDNYYNGNAPAYDIGENHVSLDFHNITYVAARNASDAPLLLWAPTTVYAWVEYNAETQQLEVRISISELRPIDPLLSYTVDLFDRVEEYMWVGFSGSTGSFWSYYYIGDWTFASYGIPTASTSAPPPSPTSPNTPVGTIVGISVAAPVLLVAIIVIVVLFFVRRRKGVWLCGLGMGSALELPGTGAYRFTYKQLSLATGGFSEEAKLGYGGFGSVYRGVLPMSGTPVAVKKISRESNQGEKEFMAEVSIISQLRHRNLIQLLGWCDDRGKYLIVYDLMPNGSLDKALFGSDKNQASLSWPQRFNIVTGIAAALDYLHQGWKQQVIHRDVKASNIMLDSQWNAKLGDFGLARLVDHNSPLPTTNVAGTYGYIAPEVGNAASGKFTNKTDVFSFGAVALEIACGRKSLAAHLQTNEMILVDWVWQRLSEGDLLSVVDRRLVEYDAHWMEVVLLVGLLCSHPDPLARPLMRQVVQVLTGDVPVPNVPASKPAPVCAKNPQGAPADARVYAKDVQGVSEDSEDYNIDKLWQEYVFGSPADARVYAKDVQGVSEDSEDYNIDKLWQEYVFGSPSITSSSSQSAPTSQINLSAISDSILAS